MTWSEFQEMFADRWLRTFMAPTLAKADDPLQDYTEPLNFRVFEKADALPERKQERFTELRERHLPLASIIFRFTRL
jgi:hypothetical protein